MPLAFGNKPMRKAQSATNGTTQFNACVLHSADASERYLEHLLSRTQGLRVGVRGPRNRSRINSGGGEGGWKGQESMKEGEKMRKALNV